MAKSSILISVINVFLVVLMCMGTVDGGKMGGKTPVTNVESNKEVQDLGRYCVQEYNRKLLKDNGSEEGKLLTFSEVTEAEKQVVSGIKYYLKISAAMHGHRAPNTFDAVVLVKPWVHLKDLLHFAPSTTPLTNTK